MMQFLTTSLSPLVIKVERAMRMTEVKVVVLTASLMMVRFLFVPAVVGLSPLTLTFCAAAVAKSKLLKNKTLMAAKSHDLPIVLRETLWKIKDRFTQRVFMGEISVSCWLKKMRHDSRADTTIEHLPC